MGGISFFCYSRFCRSSFMADGVKNAMSPINIITAPHIMKEVVNPSPSAKKPIPTSPSIAGNRLRV